MLPKRHRTWIARHSRDQEDITRLCIFMAFMMAFHLVMRKLMIFSIVTLREPVRLTIENQNLPYEVIGLVVLVSCLILLCALIHLVGLIRERRAIRIIAGALVVSSCCLVANGALLRAALKAKEPKCIARLDPRTVIIDVTKRGHIEMQGAPLSSKSLLAVLESRHSRHPHAPIIICADRRATFRDVVSVKNICNAAGFSDVDLARLRGFEIVNMPASLGEGMPENVSSNMISRVFVHRDTYVVDGQKLDYRTLEQPLTEYVQQHSDDWHVISISPGTPHDYVMWLLQLYQEQRVKNLVWHSLE